MGVEFLFRGDGSVPGLVLLLIVQLYEYVQSHWIVYFQRVRFMVCELDLS